MTTKQDPYASEEETQALLMPDTRTEAERKLAAMMAERGADEQGAEAYPILLSIALDILEAKPTFTGLPKRKLHELLAANWRINGVSIEREEDGVTKRGAVTTGGMVLWWDANQPESVSYPCEVIQADFGDNTVTLQMMNSNFKVSSGLYHLSPAQTTPTPSPKNHGDI